MSLKGLTVAVTASRRASELARLIMAFGGQPYFAPTVGINATRDIEEIRKFIDKIFEHPDFLIFMSGPGVYSLMSIAKRLGLGEKLRDALKATSLIARSTKPQAVLAKYDIHTKLIPHENTTDGILNLLKVYGIMGKKIGILWHGSYSKCFVDELSRAGAELFELTIYKYSYQLDNESATILREMGFAVFLLDESRVIKLIEDVNNRDYRCHNLYKSTSSQRVIYNCRKKQFKTVPQVIVKQFCYCYSCWSIYKESTRG